jgi:cation transport ATPase
MPRRRSATSTIPAPGPCGQRAGPARSPPLRNVFVEYGNDATLIDRDLRIQVGNLGSGALGYPLLVHPAGTPVADKYLDALMVGVNGRIAGLIHFRRADHPAAVSTLRRLQANKGLRLGILTDRTSGAGSRLARMLPLEFHHRGLSAQEKVRLLLWCRGRGFKTAYIGDCRRFPSVWREADVAISLDHAGSTDPAAHPAPIVLLQPDLSPLAKLWEIARIAVRRQRDARVHVILPNLLCVAGAFWLGFTSMSAVMITNLGTYSLYSWTNHSLRKLERRVARVRRRPVDRSCAVGTQSADRSGEPR